MQRIIFGFVFLVISKTVESGAIMRLANGQNPLEGELQLLMDGIWSSACFGNWSNENTKVICRMINNNTYRAYYEGSWGAKNCIYNITCSGNEQAIDECMNGTTYRTCVFYETVAVRCGEDKTSPSSQSVADVTVRLVDGYNENEGKVEVFVNGAWRSVANTNNTWGRNEANVICRMLGYSTMNAAGFNMPLTQVQCIGNEASFDLCFTKKGTSCTSYPYYSLYVYCSCTSSHCQAGTPYCDQSLGTCQSACSPGRYLSGSYCYPCSVNTVQPATNQNRCYYCPYGSYQNLTGQSSCKACPVGRYLNMIGQPICNSCPPGTYQDQTGQISCKQCPPGTYQSMIEQTSCIECEQGTYQNSSGKTVCIPCTGGNTTEKPGCISPFQCYKRQRDESRYHASVNFDILIVGATLLAGVISFDIISCAILLRRKGWNKGNAEDSKLEVNLASISNNESGYETTITSDTSNSSNIPNLHVNTREPMNAACHDHTAQDYETISSYYNTGDTYDGISAD